ncbi:MAG: GntR family transcriptional regulator [Devosia sp.]
MAATQIARASLSQQIKEQILARIVSGDLKPGERLVELRIAAEMETSQAPVREALRELEALGVVETLRNRGARVRTITDEELRKIYEVRAELEGYASAVVAGSGADIRLALDTAITAMREAARASDAFAFADCNSAFHRIIVEATDNEVLLELWEQLNVQARTVINVTRREQDLQRIAESHVAIVVAIASRDAAAASATAKAHVRENMP